MRKDLANNQETLTMKKGKKDYSVNKESLTPSSRKSQACVREMVTKIQRNFHNLPGQ